MFAENIDGINIPNTFVSEKVSHKLLNDYRCQNGFYFKINDIFVRKRIHLNVLKSLV